MKRVLIFTALFVLVIGTLPASAITWGEPDTDHANVGAIMVKFPDWDVICSGTLIHAKVVLTAGHCTQFIEYLLYRGWINVDDVGVTFEQDALSVLPLEVTDIFTHPDYEANVLSNPHDVGVLILESPVTGIDLASLPDEGFLDELKKDPGLRHGKEEADFTVVGYGGTLDWPPPEITYDYARQYAEAEYLALRKVWLLLSQNQATDDGGSCYGDSGGPVFWDYNGTETLVGITSWGDTKCVATGFNYRVDIPETLDFIQDVIDGL